jgi:hypothetical protein
MRGQPRGRQSASPAQVPCRRQPPAAAARARAPQRQRLAIKRLDRRERRFAPDALFVEGEALGMKASRPRFLVSRCHFILRQIRLAPWEW